MSHEACSTCFTRFSNDHELTKSMCQTDHTIFVNGVTKLTYKAQVIWTILIVLFTLLYSLYDLIT